MTQPRGRKWRFFVGTQLMLGNLVLMLACWLWFNALWVHNGAIEANVDSAHEGWPELVFLSILWLAGNVAIAGTLLEMPIRTRVRAWRGELV